MDQEINDREISVLETAATLWRYRGSVTAVISLAVLVGLASVLLTGYTAKQTISYYIELNNIENSRYPNGTAFQPSDLISPQVLGHLRKSLSLPDGLDLAPNVRITYDSPDSSGIQQVYRDRLAARNLTQPEIESINASFKEELASSTTSGLRIDVDFVSLGLNASTGVSIAKQLPLSWTEVYTKQFRTLVPQSLSASILPFKIEDFKDPSGILLTNSKIADMRRGLNAIQSDNRLNSVQESKGYTADDIQQQLQTYSNIYFNRLFSSVLDNGSVAARLYVKSQQLRIAQLNELIKGLDDAFEKLRDDKVRIDQPSNTEPQSGVQQPMVQMDANALDQIINLAERASNGEYLRGLLSKRQILVEEITDINRQIALIEPASEIQTSDSAFVEQSYQALVSIASSYNELLISARSIAQDRSGVLFQSISSPQKSGSIIDIRLLLLPVALGILAFVFSASYFIFFARQEAEVANEV